MPHEVIMPRLSDSMEEGTILAWIKQVGEVVAVGEEIVEIETDKANMAYEADVAGTLTQVLAQEGDTLPIGAPIAVIGDGADDRPVPAPPATEQVGEEEQELESVAVPVPIPGKQAGDRVRVSPLARRVAAARGVDLAAVTGSGPRGRVLKADVEAAAATPAEPSAPETAKGAVTVEAASRLQQVVARRMAESKATAPHFYLQAEIDMSEAVGGRKRLKDLAGDGELVPSFNDMVVKACALALREFPKANGAYRDGGFELYSRVNVGVAVAAPGGLVVPTVFDADRKGLRQIATDARALAAKVREGTVTPPELAGGTFTVSNLGMYGIDNFAAVVNVPQAAILAVGAIKQKPVIKDGGVTAAHLMGVTLSCDHRVLYGAEGAEFLARVRGFLEEPLFLAL